MDKRSVRKPFDLGDDVRLSPSMMFADLPQDLPSNLAQLASSGIFGNRPSANFNVFTSAPRHQPCGGCLYFDNDIARADFEALMRILKVGEKDSRFFAVFAVESERPGVEGCLTQLRIVTRFALRFLFKVISDKEYDNFREQKLSVVEVFWSFMEFERNRWGTSYVQDEQKGLAGLFGGDGDSAREKLSFGFMEENSRNGVYRIWSRAWLVTQ
ncbi:MAG: hypothetical protein PHE24_03540 [Patescibacteria group bacterium]|nr:hypothetical protein [Patescibacteria group bacterium]